MPATYFLGSVWLGDTIKDPMWDDSEVAHYNQALFCQGCGEIWGRVVWHASSTWVTTNRFCAKHSDRDCAGSFIAPWRTAFAELPPEVLRYEAQLRLDRYKENQ